MGFLDWLFKRNKPKNIKIGLALGSGGAKGFAHLGALKAMEENGIEFDIVAGTSIGSVVGAFYCAGYSSTDVMELLRRVDFLEVKDFLMFNVHNFNMFKIIDREIGSLEFSDLKKPFKAVATELETGKEHVFSSGNVAMALCASSSIPPVFKPTIIDGVRYIDGAFTNSIPADLVKEMGADYVVGIDLSTRESKSSLLKKFIPTYKSNVKEPWKKGYENSNTMLHPDLNEFSSVQFWKGNQMYEIGYKHALTMVGKIKEDIEKLKYKKKRN